ncbi:hypothetical protein V1478_009781 [Vespula squamosa]|uniref:Uncharacterized protein n=1 Tax=Vespula squamosa TaxID=30214 RepID=A0ABD2AJL3_VESSQ
MADTKCLAAWNLILPHRSRGNNTIPKYRSKATSSKAIGIRRRNAGAVLSLQDSHESSPPSDRCRLSKLIPVVLGSLIH